MLKSSNNTATITDEMIVKTLINLFYLGIMYWHTKATASQSEQSKSEVLSELEKFLIGIFVFM